MARLREKLSALDYALEPLWQLSGTLLKYGAQAVSRQCRSRCGDGAPRHTQPAGPGLLHRVGRPGRGRAEMPRISCCRRPGDGRLHRRTEELRALNLLYLFVPAHASSYACSQLPAPRLWSGIHGGLDGCQPLPDGPLLRLIEIDLPGHAVQFEEVVKERFPTRDLD